MSYHIDYDRKAYICEPFEYFDHYNNKTNTHNKLCKNDFTIVTTLGGDNNLYDENNKRRRDWYILATGFSEWEVMKQIVQMSADCEGGCLKLASQKDTHAENYIRTYRNTVKNAVKITDTTQLDDIWRYSVISNKTLEKCPCEQTRMRIEKYLTESHDYSKAKYYGNEIQYYLENITPVKLAEALTIKGLPSHYEYMGKTN